VAGLVIESLLMLENSLARPLHDSAMPCKRQFAPSPARKDKRTVLQCGRGIHSGIGHRRLFPVWIHWQAGWCRIVIQIEPKLQLGRLRHATRMPWRIEYDIDLN